MTDPLVVGLSLIEFSIAILAVFLAWFSWEYRDRKVGRPIFIMALATGAYSFASAVLSFITGPTWWHLVNNIRYPLGAVLAVSSFYVMTEFIESKRLRHRAILAGLVGFILLDFAVAMTDPFHNYVIRSQEIVDGVVVGEAGPLFYVHTGISLSVVGVSLLLLLMELPEINGIYRKQTVVVLTAFLVAVAGFSVQSFAPIHPAIDVATVGMLGWTGIIFWGGVSG